MKIVFAALLLLLVAYAAWNARDLKRMEGLSLLLLSLLSFTLIFNLPALFPEYTSFILRGRDAIWGILCLLTMVFGGRAVRMLQTPVALSLIAMLFVVVLSVVANSGELPDPAFARSAMVRAVVGVGVFVVTAALSSEERFQERLFQILAFSFAVLTLSGPLEALLTGGFTDRVGGLRLQPNGLGYYSCLGLPLLDHQRERARQGLARSAWTVAIIAVPVCVLSSGSRGAAIAFLLVAGATYWRSRRVRQLMIIAAGPAIVALVMISSGELATMDAEQLQESEVTTVRRFGTLAGQDDTMRDASLRTRQAKIEDAIEAWKESPLIGIGPWQFTDVYGKNVHNTYFQVLSELGLVGLVVFLAYLFAGLWTAWGRAGPRARVRVDPSMAAQLKRLRVAGIMFGLQLFMFVLGNGLLALLPIFLLGIATGARAAVRTLAQRSIYFRVVTVPPSSAAVAVR